MVANLIFWCMYIRSDHYTGSPFLGFHSFMFSFKRGLQLSYLTGVYVKNIVSSKITSAGHAVHAGAVVHIKRDCALSRSSRCMHVYLSMSGSYI